VELEELNFPMVKEGKWLEGSAGEGEVPEPKGNRQEEGSAEEGRK